jgi:hypothetical protein
MCETKKIKTFSNKWKLSIFTRIPPNINKQKFQTLKDLKENDDILFFMNISIL